MYNPSISIVIPSFNQGKYIERTLLSILKQEYEGSVEIIVSDGGSTDDTVDILKKYDKQITWWSEKDNGYADAVNKGFRKATGELCAIQSSDDYYLKDAFQNIVAAFERHPEVSFVCGREVLQNPDGSTYEGYTLPEIITPRGFLLDHPFPGIFQHTTFFRYEYFEKAKGMRSEFDMCADADLFYRILHFANGYFLDNYIAVYQKHDSQRTQTQTLKFEKQLLDMVISCKNDSYYNHLYAISQEDYFLFSSFIKLFYLQYSSKEQAIIQAKEVLNNSIIDKRTKNLATQILNFPVLKREQPLFKFIQKGIRIVKHLFKQYILNDKPHLKTVDKILFAKQNQINWWNNSENKGS